MSRSTPTLLPSSTILYSTIALLSLAYLINRSIKFRKNLSDASHHPGPRALLSSGSMFANVLPRIQGINHTVMSWKSKRRDYDHYRTSVIAQVSFLSGQLTYVCSTPSATTPLNHLRRNFIKPVSAYAILQIYGSNLLTTEGSEWRKHRKVAAPGFNEGVFELVWDTMQEVWWEMGKEEGLWELEEGEERMVKGVSEMTLRLALAVLSTASFGAPLSWNPAPPVAVIVSPTSPSTPPISFTQAITDVSTSIIYLLLLPTWIMKLPIPKLRRIHLADQSLRTYMYGMIKSRREALKRGEEPRRRDLFGELIGASLNEDGEGEGEKGEKGMTDEELVGNTFIFTLAGHETSAHTLAFAFSYLALNPFIQSWLFHELYSVLPSGHTPTYKDFPKLERTLAVLYETMRLCPPVILIPKVAVEDGWLEDDGEDVYPDRKGEGVGENGEKGKRRMVFVPKGTGVNIDVVGLHRHPKYWPEPNAFNPERFLEDYNKEAFLPFSAGPRGCVGRRFAEVESVLAIALTCRHFELVPRPLKPGETESQRAEKLLDAKNGLTLTPQHVDLVFKRRVGGACKRKEWIEE